MSLKYINVQLNHFCPKNCWYCYLDKDSRSNPDKFNKWDELKQYLNSADLADKVYINFTTGELSYYPNLIIKAVKEIRKVERTKDVKFIFSYVTNGDNFDITLDLMNQEYIDPDATILSYDCKIGDNHHHNTDGLYALASKVACVSTALDWHTMRDIKGTLDDVIKAGAKSWEYYLLLSNEEYTKHKFLKRFAGYFLPTVYDASNENPDIEFYNIKNIENTIDQPMTSKSLWCTYGKESIYITEDGHVIPCGAYAMESIFYSKQSRIYTQCAPELTATPDEIQTHINEARQMMCSSHSCNFKHCKASHCTECGMVAKMRGPNGQQQQCMIRSIEHNFYLTKKRVQECLTTSQKESTKG